MDRVTDDLHDFSPFEEASSSDDEATKCPTPYGNSMVDLCVGREMFLDYDPHEKHAPTLRSQLNNECRGRRHKKGRLRTEENTIDDATHKKKGMASHGISAEALIQVVLVTIRNISQIALQRLASTVLLGFASRGVSVAGFAWLAWEAICMRVDPTVGGCRELGALWCHVLCLFSPLDGTPYHATPCHLLVMRSRRVMSVSCYVLPRCIFWCYVMCCHVMTRRARSVALSLTSFRSAFGFVASVFLFSSRFLLV